MSRMSLRLCSGFHALETDWRLSSGCCSRTRLATSWRARVTSPLPLVRSSLASDCAACRTLACASPADLLDRRKSLNLWRRGWDLNPRAPCGAAGFQDRCNQPLCHLSSFKIKKLGGFYPLTSWAYPVEFGRHVTKFLGSCWEAEAVTVGFDAGAELSGGGAGAPEVRVGVHDAYVITTGSLGFVKGPDRRARSGAGPGFPAAGRSPSTRSTR